MSKQTTTELRKIINRYGEDVLWERIKRLISRGDDGCWAWAGTINGSSPVLRLVVGFKGPSKPINVPRLMYAMRTGRNIAERQVIHTCGKSWCVNPNHLELGGKRKLPTGYSNVPKGSQHKNSKLTEEAVLTIRATWKKPTDTKILAKSFGVSVDTIVDIIKRRTWKHLN